MDSINLIEQKRKDLIRRMKRETKPSRRLRMHIVLLTVDNFTPTEISQALYCSRSTVYEVAQRFVQLGEEVFDDQSPRGPDPALDESTRKRLEALVEHETPREHGFNRSRWTCSVLAAQLLRERAVTVCSETVRRALHRLKLRWRRPRPVPPEKHPEEKRRRLTVSHWRSCGS